MYGKTQSMCWTVLGDNWGYCEMPQAPSPTKIGAGYCDWHYEDHVADSLIACATKCKNTPGCTKFSYPQHGCRVSKCGKGVDDGSGGKAGACPSDKQCPVANKVADSARGAGSVYTIPAQCTKDADCGPGKECNPFVRDGKEGECVPIPQKQVTALAETAPAAEAEPFVCATDTGKCTCNGDVYFGRKFAVGRPGNGAEATFEEMKAFNKYSTESVTGSVICNKINSAQDPDPNYYKQCWCHQDPCAAKCGPTCNGPEDASRTECIECAKCVRDNGYNGDNGDAQAQFVQADIEQTSKGRRGEAPASRV